ncbi:MAG: hypothetical protein ACI93P_002654 [bacterium]|jgi:hypothetical protein
MSSYTLHIKDSNKKVLALLDLIRETEEVVLEENVTNFELSEVHKSILEERRADYLSGKSKTVTWNEIKDSVGVAE